MIQVNAKVISSRIMEAAVKLACGHEVKVYHEPPAKGVIMFCPHCTAKKLNSKTTHAEED